MADQRLSDIELLRAAYAAFNARDIDAALATMAPDVVWPKAFKGGFARGHQEVRAYWTEQWSEIDPSVEPVSFRPEGDGRTLVDQCLWQQHRDCKKGDLGADEADDADDRPAQLPLAEQRP